MFKKLIYCSLLFSAFQLNAQETTPSTSVDFELGNGLNFSFNEGNYQFKISGMVQPSIAFKKLEDTDADYFFNAKRTYFNISGKALKEKVSFFIQTDFSLNTPLLDAWVAFHPTDHLNITFGQKQTIGNNRELLIMETKLQFPDRSLLSSSLSNSGREFGLFVDYTFGYEKFAIVPQIAVTSGDGRNSFGADSRDVDYGGFKYAARLDVYPLGTFTKGNDDLVADLAHEQQLKMVVGAAASFNDGASNGVGEGHGDFLLFNALGNQQQPDYRQVYTDLLVKYKGFSLLGEYVVASATNLDGTFTDNLGANEMAPTQISEFLSLGNAMNVQLGYVTESGFGADFRYSTTTPEFGDNANSQLRDQDAVTLGLSKYFKNNDLKLQAAVSSINDNSGVTTVNTLRGELVLQLIF